MRHFKLVSRVFTPDTMANVQASALKQAQVYYGTNRNIRVWTEQQVSQDPLNMMLITIFTDTPGDNPPA